MFFSLLFDKVSNGFKIVFGKTESLQNNANHVITLSSSFSSAKYSVVTTADVSNHWVTIVSKTKGTFTTSFSDFGNKSNGGFYYICVGNG